MSRCSLDNYKDGYEVTIGWDGQLKTYFAYVEKFVGEDEEGECDGGCDGKAEGPIVWIGTSYNECLAPETLIDVIKPYATGFDSSLLLSILKLDKKTNSARRYFFEDNELCIENKEDLLRQLQTDRKSFLDQLFRKSN